MLRTLLFDLDGTLLHVDMHYFLKQYFKALTSALVDHMPPDVFMRKLWESTEAMINDTNGQKTNKDVFFENFFNSPKYKAETLMPVFEKFYRENYGALQGFTTAKPEAARLLQKAEELGFELVIATNPLFPATAIRQRMLWAGIDTFSYRLVTSYENMHFCKPKLEYYEEVLHKIGRKPVECMMIGNDVEDDMVVSQLGIKTFLVDDLLVNTNDKPIRVDWQGSLNDVRELIISLVKEERREEE
jgi:FMN phosphatase YigB (HAD superfamily)